MNQVTTLLGAGLLALLTACHTQRSVHVESQPAGARILVDGEDTGLTTPANLPFSTRRSTYRVRVERPGYNPGERTVRLDTDVDVIDADEAVMSVCCAPCCLGLPLLNLLTPVDVHRSFVPDPLRFDLDPEGQGLRLHLEPSQAEVYVDGRLQRPIDDTLLVLEAGDHDLEIRAEGRRTYQRVVHIPSRIYQELEVQLAIAGQGLVVRALPLGARMLVDDQYQGVVDEPEERLTTTPGPHSLRIEMDGYRSFEDVIVVAAEEYRTVAIELEHDGQGVVVRKPEGLGSRDQSVQIEIDGAVHATQWDTYLRLEPGEHQVTVLVPRYEPWTRQVFVQKDQFLRLDLRLEKSR